MERLCADISLCCCCCCWDNEELVLLEATDDGDAETVGGVAVVASDADEVEVVAGVKNTDIVFGGRLLVLRFTTS